MSAYEGRHLVLALLPYPHVLGVVTAAAPLSDGKLVASAEPSAVFGAAGLCLLPRRIVQAAAHTDI